MKENYNLISLFTGAGGMDIGLEMAGFKTVIANEITPYACETLRKNKKLCGVSKEMMHSFIEESMSQRCFKNMSDDEKKIFTNRLYSHDDEQYLQHCHIIERDVREIASSEIIELTKGDDIFCIAGGPPCQPFSKAGKKKSLDCTKNGDLFYEFVRLVNDINPAWFVFENVKGITFTKTDVLYQKCLECNKKELAPFKIRQNLNDEKNNNTCQHCQSHRIDYEVKNEPGGSLKIILNEFEKIGYLCSVKVLNSADFGVPQIRERLFIVGNKYDIKYKFPEQTHEKKDTTKNQMSDLLPWNTMRNCLWPENHDIYGKFDRESARLWVKNVVRPHDEPVTWCLDRPSPTIGAHQGAKLAFAPQGVPEKQIYRQQWATKGRKQGDTPPVKVEHKYLTDRELLCLQSFPDWWYLHGTRMERAFQIGNAVPPTIAKIIGKSIIKQYKDSK